MLDPPCHGMDDVRGSCACLRGSVTAGAWARSFSGNVAALGDNRLQESLAAAFWALLLPVGRLAWAQMDITATMRDAATLHPLAAAPTVVEGQQQGTISNSAGPFEILVQALSVVLLAQHLGYETVRVEVGPSNARSIAVALPEVIYQMEEVLIARDEFAENLMRRVVCHKSWCEPT